MPIWLCSHHFHLLRHLTDQELLPLTLSYHCLRLCCCVAATALGFITASTSSCMAATVMLFMAEADQQQCRIEPTKAQVGDYGPCSVACIQPLQRLNQKQSGSISMTVTIVLQ